MPLRRSDTMRAVDAVQPLVDQFNALDEGDKLTFLDLVDPLPDKLSHSHKQKKSSKKAAGGSGRSKRGESLASAIKGTGDVTVPLTGVEAKTSVGQLGVKIEEDGVLSSGSNRCQFTRSGGRVCMLLPDHNIHHLPTANEYHEFQPPATSAAGSGG